MNDENIRLRAVNRFVNLDESITRDLNNIADLIAQICDTPVALITLLGQDTQWFKAGKGVDMESTPREMAFCNHTIKQENLLIVPDLTQDERFAENPLVTGSINARFYAGAPLITDDGYALGSLCVVDFKPKTLDESQQKALRILSKQVLNMMQLGWTVQNLEHHHKHAIQQNQLIEDSELKLKAVFNSSSDLNMLVGKQFEILACNKSAQTYFQKIYRKAPQAGDNMLDFIDKGVVPQITRYLLSALAGRVIKKELLVRAGTPYQAWREVKFMPIKNAANEVIGVAFNAVDISHRKMQEEQIKIQNAALTRIAIIQSHELRRPVASLLGLLDIIKMGPHTQDMDCLDMMHTTINELDQKIRLIVKDSEDTIQSPLSIVA
ncbi:MAG: GAF domain-containing protein [Sphingobacteriaceae bacterium]|nr:MAG: GAF domain-containing protein [Sphingobacteriaceae bacterium]